MVKFISLLIVGWLLFAGGVSAVDLGVPFHASDVGLTDFNGANVVDGVKGGDKGSKAAGGMLTKYVDIGKKIIAAVAVVVLLWSALTLVTAGGSDDKVGTAKLGVVWSLLGLIMMLMLNTAIFDIFYGGRNIDTAGVLTNGAGMDTSIKNATDLVVAGMNWAQAILIIIAVVFLMLSGFKMIAALGNQEDITKQKTVFLWIGVGVVVMLINRVIVQSVIYSYVFKNYKVTYEPDADAGIIAIMRVVKYFLVRLAVGAFVAFVYGAGMMITAYGDDERVSEGRKIIFSAIIGIILILVSYAMVATLTGLKL